MRLHSRGMHAPQRTRATVPRLGLSMEDPRVLTVVLDRVTGVNFGCDLSLCWPYVMGMVPSGSAECSGEVLIGDQLVAVAGKNVLGLPMGEVMASLGTAEGAEISLTFFRGERAALQSCFDTPDSQATATVTLREPGKPEQQFAVPCTPPADGRAPPARMCTPRRAMLTPTPTLCADGANLRDELIARKINCYQSITRWTNCNGKQLCGTCIVDVSSGVESCTRRSLDEASTLRENPLTYKLACITNVYGDVTVELRPEVGAAQWTR